MAPQILIKKESRVVKEASPSPSVTSSIASSGGKRKLDADDEMDREKKRKLMNRVAAQQSRDRKRLHMEEMEKEIKKLRQENSSLKNENQKFKLQNEKLQVENEILRCQQVGSVKEESSVSSSSVGPLSSDNCVVPEVVSSSTMAFESAALISGPLQQEQAVKTLISWLMHCVWIMQLTSTRQISSSSSRTYGRILLERLTHLRSHIHRSCSGKKELREPWWGPHQQSWNPSKISCSADRTIPPCS